MQQQVLALQTKNLKLKKEKTELITEMNEFKAKLEDVEYAAHQSRLKILEEVQRVDAQRREINSKYQELEYRYKKQIEVHGDYDLIDKENSALNKINRGLEKQIEMLSKELVEVKAKHEGAMDEVKKLTSGTQDLMMMISEANKIKREQYSIIQKYKLLKQQRESMVIEA